MIGLSSFTHRSRAGNPGPAGRRRAGFLLPETIIASAIVAIMVLAIVSFMFFSGRSFAALFNYVDLNDDNRVAIDQMTRDVRQARRVVSYQNNIMSLENLDGTQIVYTHDPNAGTLVRQEGGVRRVLLNDCENLTFTMGQRNAVGGTYEVFPAATAATAKVINVSWVCSRTIFGSKQNSESVQTARIVIRKQGT